MVISDRIRNPYGLESDLFVDGQDDMGDFQLRDGLPWIVRQQLEQLDTIARGFMLVKGPEGSGKDLFMASTAKMFSYYYNRPILLDFQPKVLFGHYALLDSVAIIRMITEVAKALRVEGLEGSQDKGELAQFMEEAIVRWLLEGRGYDIFHKAVWCVSELKKVAYNRNHESRTNKFIGTLGTVWRHLDLLFIGTHVFENELDPKAYLQYTRLRAKCSQTMKPDIFRVDVERGMWAGPTFVIANVRLKPLTFWINGREPRDFLDGGCFYDLYQSKHMKFSKR